MKDYPKFTMRMLATFSLFSGCGGLLIGIVACVGKEKAPWFIALIFAGMIGISALQAIAAQSKRIDDLENQLKSKKAEPVQ